MSFQNHSHHSTEYCSYITHGADTHCTMNRETQQVKLNHKRRLNSHQEKSHCHFNSENLWPRLTLQILPQTIPYLKQLQIKVKVTPSHAYTGTEGRRRYNSNPSATSVLEGGGWSAPRSGRFIPGKKPGTHCTKWTELGARLNGHGKSRPHRDSIPGPSGP